MDETSVAKPSRLRNVIDREGSRTASSPSPAGSAISSVKNVVPPPTLLPSESVSSATSSSSSVRVVADNRSAVALQNRSSNVLTALPPSRPTFAGAGGSRCSLRQRATTASASRSRDREVAGDRDRASFVGGVDQAVEAFGGVRGDGEETDVVDDDQVGADDLREGPGDGVVGAVAADWCPEVFDGEPGDGQAGLDRGLSEGLGEVALAGARLDSKPLRAQRADVVRGQW